MLFKNANIFVGGQFQHGSFRVENGRFAEILTTVPDEDGTDLQGRYVIPGLIDVHNHGNSGADFSDGDYDGLIKMARYLAQNGVTSFAPASMTLPYDVLEAAYKTAVQLKKAQPEGCAHLMGIQMEGPFFSEKKKGAQNGAYLRDPDFAAFQQLYDASEGLIRIADVAAELPGAVEFAEKASKLCTVSIAHTDCTYEEASAVLDAGASHLTHLYNAMPGIYHRKPGPIGAGSERENVVAELICDGQHIHPSAVRMAFMGNVEFLLFTNSFPCTDGRQKRFGIFGYVFNTVRFLFEKILLLPPTSDVLFRLDFRKRELCGIRFWRGKRFSRRENNRFFSWQSPC